MGDHDYLEQGRMINSALLCRQRTSDGGNGNRSVSLPIILINIKVNQMLSSSYISLCWSVFYDFAIDFLFSIKEPLYFEA